MHLDWENGEICAVRRAENHQIIRRQGGKKQRRQPIFKAYFQENTISEPATVEDLAQFYENSTLKLARTMETCTWKSRFVSSELALLDTSSNC